VKESDIPELLLDNIPKSIVYVDNSHTIRYANTAGKEHYSKWGDIIGRSLFECHNERSNSIILDIHARMLAGEDEFLIIDKPTHRSYVRSVRDAGGTLVGYYEIHEPPAGK
jgi:DUF438 domain-containing protein